MEKEKQPRRTPASMYPVIQRWENSGKSQIAFARAEGIPQVVFSYWLQKYRQSKISPIPGFVAVTPAGKSRQDIISDSGGQAFARLILPNGTEVHFQQNVPGHYLRELLGW